MRSTFSVSTWTWALASCLALFLGCRQGEGDRCEVDSDCEGSLTCSARAGGSEHDKTCRPKLGANTSTGQGSGVATSTGTSTSTFPSSTDTSTVTSTDTSTGATDASVSPSGGEPDAGAPVVDGALAD